jgi:hypothetical protein
MATLYTTINGQPVIISPNSDDSVELAFTDATMIIDFSGGADPTKLCTYLSFDNIIFDGNDIEFEVRIDYSDVSGIVNGSETFQFTLPVANYTVGDCIKVEVPLTNYQSGDYIRTIIFDKQTNYEYDLIFHEIYFCAGSSVVNPTKTEVLA